MKVPRKPPPVHELLKELSTAGPEKILSLAASDIERKLEGKYVHWDELRRRPAPQG